MTSFPQVEMHGADESVTLLPALASSAVAGLVQLLVWMAASALFSQGFWTPPRLAAGALWGPGALLGGPAAVLLGLGLSLGFAAAWGLLYASALRSGAHGPGRGLALGVAYGGLVFLVMYLVIAPWGDPTLFTQARPGPLLLADLAYGAVLGLWAPLNRARPRPVPSA